LLLKINRRADLKKARDELGGIIREKEAAMNSKKRKQVVMDSLLVPRSKQSPAATAKKSNNKHLDLAVARFFFENAIPFNVASSSSFSNMIVESMAFRLQNSVESYKTPNRKKLSGQLLDDVYTSIQESVLPVLAAAAKYGSSIASDGWSDVHRRPILNFMNLTVASSKRLIEILKNPMTKSACAVCARADSHKTYSLNSAGVR
jgi:hypothetical protein